MSTTVRLISLATILLPTAAFAQTGAAPPTDFTGIAIAIVGGVFSVIGIVATAMINSHMKDTQAAATLNAAIGNSLGAVQNALDAGLKSHPLQAAIPGISPTMAAGVQYGLDHAGDEAERLGVSPAAIADKIDARLGLAKIATNLAAAAPVMTATTPAV
jgi:hypothetical protein